MWGTTLVDLEPLGPGLPLYFLLLRYLSCFFIFATLLTLPSVLFSIAGSSLDTVALATEIDAIHASFISIAAIGLPVTPADNATLVPLPSRPSLAFSRRGASVVIMSVDLAMSLLFLVFTVTLSRCIAAEARRVHRRVPQASDYAVYVTGLPTDATEEEVWGERRQAGAARWCLCAHPSHPNGKHLQFPQPLPPPSPPPPLCPGPGTLLHSLRPSRARLDVRVVVLQPVLVRPQDARAAPVSSSAGTGTAQGCLCSEGPSVILLRGRRRRVGPPRRGCPASKRCAMRVNLRRHSM